MADDLSTRVAGLETEQQPAATTEARVWEAADARIPRRPAGMEHPPLSFAQEQLWFLDQFAPGQSIYNIPMSLRLRGYLDVDALRMALAQVVRRHESLRTTFASEHGVPHQVIAPTGKLTLPIEDLTHLPAEEREVEAMRLAHVDGGQAFDLQHDRLFRARLLRLSPEDHILSLVVHHIVADGWSAVVLFGELGQVYGAILEQSVLALPPLDIQYGDYATWQREWLRSEDAERQLRFWDQQLAGISVVELPTDRPRPQVPSGRGGRYIYRVPPELTDRLRELSRRSGATMYMTVLAAFDALLARYSGQEDITVGTAAAGRSRPQLGSLIGFFVNMVVLRTDLSGDPTFVELLQRVRDTTLGAYEHQEVPFAKVVERAHIERDTSRNPLFQVAIGLQSESQIEFQIPGIDLELVNLQTQGARFDIAINAFEGPNGMLMWVEYAADLFDRSRIERMLQHYQQVLEAVVERPDIRLSEIPVLSEEERRTVLRDWQGPSMAYRHAPVHTLIAEQVARTPDAAAATFGGETLTYGELERRAESLARYLRGMGVAHEDVVGIAIDRSFDQLCAIYGILKAGAAFVPLDLSHPPKRLSYILEDTSAKAVLTSSELAGRLPEGGDWTPVVLDRSWPEIEATASGEPLEEWANASSLAYVLYTSGSTGRPKGVLIEHGAIANFCAWLTSVFSVGPGDRMLQFVSLIFDLAEGEIFTALSTGATLVLAPKESLSPTAMAEVIATERVSYVGAPPAMLSLVSPGPYPELRSVLVGGEACPPELVNRWNTEGRTFVNGYGPTEATIGCIYHPCEHTTHRSQPPIGRAMPNRVAYVVDAWGNPVPVGVPGEVLTGGVGLARGYLDRPDLTAERFVPDPFASQPGARLYRTGDLGRWSEEGTIQFLGRIDTQVKLRGQRIELEEVEAALSSHPQVGQATVVLREDTPGDKRLVGYLIPRDGEVPSVSELRDHLSTEVPAYMVPAAFVTLEAFPLLPTGKVDRSALPAPEATRPELASTYLAPRNEAERTVAGVFADVLSIERAGAEDNFFELGGSSLQAGQVVSRLREAFGAEVSVREFYTSPSVADVAAMLERTIPQEPEVDWDLLSRIESLSEEEVDRLLAAEAGLEASAETQKGASGDG